MSIVLYILLAAFGAIAVMSLYSIFFDLVIRAVPERPTKAWILLAVSVIAVILIGVYIALRR